MYRVGIAARRRPERPQRRCECPLQLSETVWDQQIPLERAFAAPLELSRRLGRGLDAAELADADPEELAAGDGPHESAGPRDALPGSSGRTPPTASSPDPFRRSLTVWARQVFPASPTHTTALDMGSRQNPVRSDLDLTLGWKNTKTAARRLLIWICF
jgi:hypothetical protein